MRFRIRHRTTYAYSAPVRLGPHVLRLRPRDDGAQRLDAFTLAIDPAPVRRATATDAAGNVVAHAWFGGSTTALAIDSEFAVETLRADPFDYVPDAAFAWLPVWYAATDVALLAPYRSRPAPDASVDAFAAAIAAASAPHPVAFLAALNAALHDDFHAHIRDGGPARAPAQTLAARSGACRDLTLLFLDAARAQGFAARFVSGYRRGDLARPDRHLHAWAEVFVPGGGWRGYDPVEGQPIADAHVALAAGPAQVDTMTVEGGFDGAGVHSKLDYAVEIAVD
jgi:transglutaminase-like putative cysteine protease